MRQMKDFPRLLEKLRARISQTNTMLTLESVAYSMGLYLSLTTSRRVEIP